MATKKQKEYAANFLKENLDVKAIFLNPKKSEFFTDEDFANNSIDKDREGKPNCKIETFKQNEKIDTAGDDEITNQ
ncbi:hypothetical protein [Epilithonimonas mollis]|uniref:Uncharacterized protein n=1 Tax=Epilithonimonas mollis TaxID=216903 RepID=A0A1M6UKB4_9FLAO|nr:hypothetical protein [Epilithonimonas mollis]SHK69685.1 hypothetical protein SAMN05444371_3351 [Epilithonimonas mollis]